MVIKLTRMVNYNSSYLKTNSIVDIPEADALGLIQAKCAIAVDKLIQEIAVNPIPEIKASTKSNSNNNTSASNKQTVKPEVDEEESIDDNIDISNFKIIEEVSIIPIAGPYQIPGVSNETITVLVKKGYDSLNSLKGISKDTLLSIPKIGYNNSVKISDYVKGL